MLDVLNTPALCLNLWGGSSCQADCGARRPERIPHDHVPRTLWHPQGKKAGTRSAPFPKFAEGGPCTRWCVGCISFQARTMAAQRGSRAPSQLARPASRCIEPDGVGASAVGPLVQQSQR